MISIEFLIKDGMTVDQNKTRKVEPYYSVTVFREVMKNISQSTWYEKNVEEVKYWINILPDDKNMGIDSLVNEIKRCFLGLENDIQIYFCLKIIERLLSEYDFTREITTLQLKSPIFRRFASFLLHKKRLSK